MFIIKPVDDREECKKLFIESNVYPFDSSCFAVLSKEDGKEAGYCLFRHDSYTVEILFLRFNEGDNIMGDTLLRSALNYAGNRNAYNAICKKLEYSDLLKALGFVKNDGVFTSTIPEIFTTCKNCKGK